MSLLPEDYLTTVAKKLRRPIPSPRQEPAKPQASWHLLKPGQRLRSKLPVETLPGARVREGNLWEVLSCSNKGALMKPLELPTKVYGHLLWTDPEWGRTFEREGGKQHGSKKRKD
jgi:hypothetical protein